MWLWVAIQRRLSGQSLSEMVFAEKTGRQGDLGSVPLPHLFDGIHDRRMGALGSRDWREQRQHEIFALLRFLRSRSSRGRARGRGRSRGGRSAHQLPLNLRVLPLQRLHTAPQILPQEHRRHDPPPRPPPLPALRLLRRPGGLVVAAAAAREEEAPVGRDAGQGGDDGGDEGELGDALGQRVDAGVVEALGALSADDPPAALLRAVALLALDAKVLELVVERDLLAPRDLPQREDADPRSAAHAPLLGDGVGRARVVDEARRAALPGGVDAAALVQRHEVVVPGVALRRHPPQRLLQRDHLPHVLHDERAPRDPLQRPQAPALVGRGEGLRAPPLPQREALVLALAAGPAVGRALHVHRAVQARAVLAAGLLGGAAAVVQGVHGAAGAQQQLGPLGVDVLADLCVRRGCQ